VPPTTRSSAVGSSSSERSLAALGLALARISRDERTARGVGGFDVRRIETEMRAAARRLRGAPVGCNCWSAHRAPLVAEVPPWPPRPSRAKAGPEHPWRADRRKPGGDAL
jgi:hypothetical protein